MAKLFLSPRIRKSPYFEATRRYGAKEFSVYNQMYLPMGYSDPETEFWNLVNNVTLWDVAAQRIVEITGPDALAFTNLLTPRDLTKGAVGQCKYVVITSQDGGILNDPLLLRLGEDRFWLSRADGDVLLWAKGVAVNARMEVDIREPDVAPLQVQGPKSKAVSLGCPVVYGRFTSNVDMRSGAPAFGTPEQTRAAHATGRLCHRSGMPFRSSNTNASNCVDAQAAYESEMSLWGAPRRAPRRSDHVLRPFTAPGREHRLCHAGAAVGEARHGPGRRNAERGGAIPRSRHPQVPMRRPTRFSGASAAVAANSSRRSSPASKVRSFLRRPATFSEYSALP